eukprot:Rhum_TRINITY_DN16710_c0_g1::Rhum_TRINITY_DN16710_c0_g1_i1::g.164137::m.164137
MTTAVAKRVVARKAARAAARRFEVDGPIDMPPAVRSVALAKGGANLQLSEALRKQWPVSARAERQRLTQKMAAQQGDRSTFSREYYHHTYEQYLGNPASYDDVLPLVMQRKVHWTDLLLCKDTPPLPELKYCLQQAGVKLERDGEAYATWLVALAAAAQQRPAEWPLVHAELQELRQTWVSGAMSERHTLGVAVLAHGFELRECFETLADMREGGMLFTSRGFQILTSRAGVRHDIVNGDTVAPDVAGVYKTLVGSSSSQMAGVHALFVYALRRKRSAVFWWCVRLYAEYKERLGPLATQTISLLFVVYMHARETLHADTVAALADVFASHGLLKHCAAVLRDYAPRVAAGECPPLARSADALLGLWRGEASEAEAAELRDAVAA